MSNWFDDRPFPELYYPGESFPGEGKPGGDVVPGSLHLGGHGHFPGEFFCEEYFVPPHFGGSEWMLDHGVRPEDLVPHGVPEKKKRAHRGNKGRKGHKGRTPTVIHVKPEEARRVFGPWIDLDARDELRRRQAAELTQQAIERVKQKADEELWIVMMMASILEADPVEDEEQIALDLMLAIAGSL